MCQLILPQILNVYFPKVVEIFMVQGNWEGGDWGEGGRRHFSQGFL